MKAHITTRVMLLGFELELYAIGELRCIYWYLRLASAAIVDSLDRLGTCLPILTARKREAQLVSSMATASLLFLVSHRRGSKLAFG